MHTPDEVSAEIADLAVNWMPEIEHVYSARSPGEDDVVVVARADGTDEGDGGRTGEGGGVVGFLVASCPSGEPTQIWEHVVAPSHRGHGIGRALLHHLASGAAASGDIVMDPTHQLDPVRLGDYYRSCGFTESEDELRAPAAQVQRRTAPDSGNERQPITTGGQT
ncbi:MAG: GNAT family N-acetyltransferase [Actinomycetota bacterium]|nr:GNAT family N-acetyltransferase [Actinomycetota bacterium]